MRRSPFSVFLIAGILSSSLPAQLPSGQTMSRFSVLSHRNRIPARSLLDAWDFHVLPGYTITDGVDPAWDISPDNQKQNLLSRLTPGYWSAVGLGARPVWSADVTAPGASSASTVGAVAQGRTSLTLAMVVQTPSVSALQYAFVDQVPTGSGTGARFGLILGNTAGSMRFGARPTAAGAFAGVDGPAALAANTTYRVIGIWDGDSGRISLYYNGVKQSTSNVGTGTAAAIDSGQSAAITFGEQGTNQANYWLGRISYAAISVRALSDPEAKELDAYLLTVSRPQWNVSLLATQTNPPPAAADQVQGLATDGTDYVYLGSTVSIYKYAWPSGSYIGKSTAITDHLGGIEYFSGSLYASESLCPDSGTSTNQHIYYYDASTLAKTAEVDLSADFTKCLGAVGRNPVNGHFYVGESTGTGSQFDRIVEYSVSGTTWTKIQAYTTTVASASGVQGIKYVAADYNGAGGFRILGHNNKWYNINLSMQNASIVTHLEGFALQDLAVWGDGTILWADRGMPGFHDIRR